jgi:hypothetical protein
MAMIYVRAREGRKAFHEGKVIPQDKFVPVPDTPYIRRLVSHWNDLEVEGDFDPKAPPAKKSPGKNNPRPVVGAKTKVEPSPQWAPGTGAPGPKA